MIDARQLKRVLRVDGIDYRVQAERFPDRPGHEMQKTKEESASVSAAPSAPAPACFHGRSAPPAGHRGSQYRLKVTVAGKTVQSLDV